MTKYFCILSLFLARNAAEDEYEDEFEHVEDFVSEGQVLEAPLEDFNLHSGPREPRGWGDRYTRVRCKVQKL